MVCLNPGTDVLLLHKVGAEEYEGVGWAGDISLTPSLVRWASFTCGCGHWCFCGWEEGGG